MAKSPLSIPKLAEQVPDEAAAYEFLENLRWDGEPVCPHCGSVRKPYFLSAKNGGRKTRTGSVSHRRVWKCADCRRQFSVLTGTIFHGTKIPVRTWLFVVVEMASSKNGVAAREIERKYDLTSKTAWFMLHRIREAMKREPLAGLLRGHTEADETYYGGKAKNKVRGGYKHKTPIVTLVNRETGEARSRVVPNVTGEALPRVLREQMTRDSVLLTDGHRGYEKVGRLFTEHHRVRHEREEYAYTTRGGIRAHTNTVEGFFSQLKRSLDGTYHHVSVEHLDRYLAEFDFRYSTRKMTDAERTEVLVSRVAGRRLLYQDATA